MICVVYVLQTQDLLTTSDRGIGTGLNVWDIVSYGVVVSFGGGAGDALRSEPLSLLSEELRRAIAGPGVPGALRRLS